MNPVTPPEILEFLCLATPPVWAEQAVAALPVLLNDHANCEKKAAATALGLVFRYARHSEVVVRMSRVAREELRHFEQVLAFMMRRGIPLYSVSASRYAASLRRLVRGDEPGRLVDLLVCGAYIEARSAERFGLLIPLLDAELARFYERLHVSETRHYRNYLELARGFCSTSELEERVRLFSGHERRLVTETDVEIRFHSGPLPC